MNEYIRTTDNYGKFYYKDKERTILHREDGPAIEWYCGDKDWYFNGKRHRIDGPATEIVNGASLWFINDEYIFRVDNSGKVTGRMK
jgi:hypothetical protein